MKTPKYITISLLCLLIISCDNHSKSIIKEPKIDNTHHTDINKSQKAKENGFDFNHDGLPDKVVLEKNQQDESNFDIDIIILENNNGKFKQLTQNSLILKEPTNGCPLDGLETFKTHKDTITITYTTCDDNKFVRRVVDFSYNANQNDFILNKNIRIAIDDKNFGKETTCKVIGKTFTEFYGECN